MILLNNENIALLEGDIVLTENDARLPSLIFPMYNTSNSKLLDVPPPEPFVPNAWQWDEANQTWIEHDPVAIQAARDELIPKPVVPTQVSMRQARIALLRAGLLDTVTAYLSQDQEAAITWEFATEVRRNDPLIEQVKQMANMTDEQIDNLFIEASQL